MDLAVFIGKKIFLSFPITNDYIISPSVTKNFLIKALDKVTKLLTSLMVLPIISGYIML